MLETFLRAVDTQGDVYLPYVLRGDFTPSERAVIEELFEGHIPKTIGAMFNNWIVYKLPSGSFYAWRATWDTGFTAETADEMADKISKYFSR